MEDYLGLGRSNDDCQMFVTKSLCPAKIQDCPLESPVCLEGKCELDFLPLTAKEETWNPGR